MLESENIIVRRQSAIVLGKLGDEKALEILVEFLKDQRYESTIADIFYKQEGKSLKILLKALHESDDETKKKIIMRLSGFSFTQPWLAKEIVRFLESNNKDLRITASESLKTFANFEIVDEVLEILKEENMSHAINLILLLTPANMAFSLAKRRALKDISVATKKIFFNSLAKDMEIAPLPVPNSKT